MPPIQFLGLDRAVIPPIETEIATGLFVLGVELVPGTCCTELRFPMRCMELYPALQVAEIKTRHSICLRFFAGNEEMNAASTFLIPIHAEGFFWAHSIAYPVYKIGVVD